MTIQNCEALLFIFLFLLYFVIIFILFFYYIYFIYLSIICNCKPHNKGAMQVREHRRRISDCKMCRQNNPKDVITSPDIVYEII